MPNPLTVGIIGCGSMGRGHARNAALIPALSLRAYADIQEPAAKSCYHELGGSYYTADPHQIIGDDGVDLVVIATPNHLHADLAVKAARAGKHVLIEKPMALTLSDCWRIEEAIAAAGVKATVDLKFRFARGVQVARRALQKPLVTVAQSLMPPTAHEGEWRLDPEKGGGIVFDLGSHLLDMVYWLNRSEIVNIYATGGAMVRPGSSVIDSVAATLQLEGGAIGTVVIGEAGMSSLTSKWFVELFDGQRAATVHAHGAEVVLDGFSDQEKEAALSGTDNRSSTLLLLEAFARSILQDTEPPITVRDGTRATLLILKAFESIRTGQPQKV